MHEVYKMSSHVDSELHIDKFYYNTLDVESFALMLKSPSYCYKFYWLEALVGLISEGMLGSDINSHIGPG